MRLAIFIVVILLNTCLWQLLPLANESEQHSGMPLPNEKPLGADKHLATEDKINYCELYQEILSDRYDVNDYREFTSVTGEDTRVNISVTSYVKNSKELFALMYLSKRSEHRYMGIFRLYPDVDLVLLVENPVVQNHSSYPKEIEDFLKDLEPVDVETWKGMPGYSPGNYYNRCFPMTNTVPGKQFDDGINRKFVRHVKLGTRTYTGKLICDSWGQINKQFHLYQSFIPKRIHINGVDVYIDSEFGGATTGVEFSYACHISKYIEAKIIKVPNEDNSDEKEPLTTQKYLESIGLTDLANPEHYYNNRWELQILRNIIEGRKLFEN